METWVKKNEMVLVAKRAKLQVRGRDFVFRINNQVLGVTKYVKDLYIYFQKDNSWKNHYEFRVRKANKVLYWIHRNVAVQVKTVHETQSVQILDIASSVVRFHMCIGIKS